MLRLSAAFVLVSAAPAQVIVDPAKLPPAYRDFRAEAGETTLSCSVQAIRPTLNFGFRFQAGWVARVPLRQFVGKGHRWAMVTRITPEIAAAKPVYLVSAVVLPEVPQGIKAEAEVGGGFLLGEGNYTVDWMLTDEKERVCRKSWRVDVKLRRAERNLRIVMPPGAVSELSLRGSTRPPPPGDDDVRRIRLTVLLHAAPLSPRRTRIRVSDRMMLLGSVAALLEQLPTRGVRLVVFNLDQQRELLRQENFTLDGLDRVSQSMNELELGTVDYRVLQNRRGHIDLLATLVNRELSEEDRADAVVVLGPSTRYFGKMPGDAIERPEDAPDFYYFQFQPYMRATATFPDAITSTVSRMKGRTTIIRSPGDFARAIAQIAARAD